MVHVNKRMQEHLKNMRKCLTKHRITSNGIAQQFNAIFYELHRPYTTLPCNHTGSPLYPGWGISTSSQTVMTKANACPGAIHFP